MSQTIQNLSELFVISKELQRQFNLECADPVMVMCDLSSQLRKAQEYISSHKQIIPFGAKWSIGDTVAKKQGSSWRGKVVGYYTTANTQIGYCVESLYESGSVQVLPEAALMDWKAPEPAQPYGDQGYTADDLKAADPQLGGWQDGNYSVTIRQIGDVFRWAVYFNQVGCLAASASYTYDESVKSANSCIKNHKAVIQLTQVAVDYDASFKR